MAFTAGALGSGTLINHTADCSGTTADANASPITVTGLTPGASTTCKVRTTTTAGVSAWSSASAAVVISSSEVTYFHNDISGSPMVATDSAGAVVWKENYRPYGERVNTANNQSASASNSVWFAGKPFDSSTGLSYMGARYYDPVLGRFMGVDPVGFNPNNIHSFNRYTYANNNPYKYRDPDGKNAVLISRALYVASFEAATALGAATLGYWLADKAWGIMHNESAGSGDGAKGDPKGADKPSLLDPKGEGHILDGDATGGGHAPGTGKPGKSEFPSGWSRDKIKGEVSDVATDPNSTTEPGRNGRTVVTGTRDGVDIQVIVEPPSRDNGRIVTGYPTNVPRNPR